MENIQPFISRQFEQTLPSRQELRDIEKALIKDGLNRGVSVIDFVNTPPPMSVND